MTRYTDNLRNMLERRPELRLSPILEGDFAIVYVPRDLVEEVRTEIGPVGLTNLPIIMGLMGQRDLESAGITQVYQETGMQGDGVLLGFVDTGIDYTNNAFRYENGSTRIASLWDQTISGNPPGGYMIGTEYGRELINEALSSDAPFSIVPSRDTVGHGTFLASVAGSSEEGEYRGAAPASELLVVKLRKANAYFYDLFMIPSTQENAYASTDVMLGVEYIIGKARELRRPVAICIGLGSNTGSHDGFNVIEEYLARVANTTGTAVCIAAGNEALARHHVQGVMDPSNGVQNIEVIAEEGTHGLNIELWNGAPDRFSVSVTSPVGEIVGRVPARPGNRVEANLILERARVTVEYYFPNPRSGSQLTWIQIWDPTPGVWTVTAYGDIVVEGTYHCWLPIEGFSAPGTAFVGPSPNCTVTLPSTSMGVLTIGAYSTQFNSLYANSSWGPTRLPALSPDLTAPGVEVGGVFPSGYGAMSGTSVAAAITCGACALMLQWGIVEKNEPSLNTYLIRSHLITGCEREAGVVYPNEQWGYGRLNLYNTFSQLE